ncbi:splicing factor ESS-2 homolog isoform X1 [Ranitomeya imitator]|uniref:splicing factor ESS-2 homolog isoform X1 n=1 Tax=Ranitomeya imitator TaxID=111125 RepID=UPI001AA3C9F8
MVPKPDSGTFLVLFLLVLTLTEPLRPGPRVVLARLQSELRCTHVQFACHSGAIQCIPLQWQCDGWPTCEDESDEVNCPGVGGDQRGFHGKESVESRHGRVRTGEGTRFQTVNLAQPVRFSSFLGKCPSGWHHYDGTASCYKVYSSGENYWDAVQTCQKVNGSLATFTTDSELKFILAQEWEMEERPYLRKDQRRLWVGYQFVITNRNHSVEGHWEVAYKGSSEVFLPPVPIFGMYENENILCAQLQYFYLPSLRHHGLHSWYAENCYEKSSFLCKRSVPDNDAIFKKPREVVHKNTRFQKDPFSQALSKTQLQQAAALNAQYKQGKVGPDGKELIPQESPKVNGFGFVATPSPAPGVDDSPLMTWGEVESTPFRLDGSETPYVEKTPGPSFKILEPGRRERLGLKMANEAAAKNRAKKQEALRRVTENLASLTPKGLSPSMSPALQRLVNRTSSKYTDKALRASYTPSPAHSSLHVCKTPGGSRLTPTVTPTPGASSQTPTAPDPTSITDNLLHLPKRRKASDFF